MPKVKEEFTEYMKRNAMTLEFWRWICGHYPKLAQYFEVTIPDTSLQEKIEQAIKRSKHALEE